MPSARLREIPTMLDYRTHVDKGSMFNTPPVVPIYCALENLRWIKKQGGVEAMDKLAQQRAEIVYGEIDRNKMFVGTAKEEDRSLMNICFVMLLQSTRSLRRTSSTSLRLREWLA